MLRAPQHAPGQADETLPEEFSNKCYLFRNFSGKINRTINDLDREAIIRQITVVQMPLSQGQMQLHRFVI